MTIPLSEKYRPKKFVDILGQEIVLDKVKSFFNSFKRGTTKKKAIILHGPAGTGKTTIADIEKAKSRYKQIGMKK